MTLQDLQEDFREVALFAAVYAGTGIDRAPERLRAAHRGLQHWWPQLEQSYQEGNVQAASSALASASNYMHALINEMDEITWYELGTTDALVQQFADEDAETAQLEAEFAAAADAQRAAAAVVAGRLKQPSVLMVKTGRLLPTRRNAIAVLIRESQTITQCNQLAPIMKSLGLDFEVTVNDATWHFPNNVFYDGYTFRFNLMGLDLTADYSIREVQS